MITFTNFKLNEELQIENLLICQNPWHQRIFVYFRVDFFNLYQFLTDTKNKYLLKLHEKLFLSLNTYRFVAPFLSELMISNLSSFI
jgi:hypothetical protein